MERNLRRDLAAERQHAEILHDERVHPGARRRGDQPGKLLHFAVRDQRVERQVHLNAAHMAIAHGLRQLLRREVSRAAAGVKDIRAQIDRVRAVADGRAQGFHRASGRKQFQHNQTPRSRPLRTRRAPAEKSTTQASAAGRFCPESGIRQ